MEERGTSPLSVDVLIVGSGPIGATFARVLAERAPEARIMMLDAGPQLTRRPGMHVKNMDDAGELARAQIRSQGPDQYPYEIPSVAERAAAAQKSGRQRVSMLARPGTHLVTTEDADLDRSGMPAAALSSNVGGMGAHWTCACPPPGNTERIPFIPQQEWDQLFLRASELLHVTQAVYAPSIAALAIQQTLGEVFDAALPEGRKVQPMPLACLMEPDGRRYWAGPDVILGPLADEAAAEGGRFTLRAETICRQVLTAGGRATGALVEHLPSGTRETIAAKVVVVAADALRTPQVLWASGIRPRALGHYLNDQPQIVAGVELSEQVLERARAALQASGPLSDGQREAEAVQGVFWVPFHDPEHPFHGQIMHLDLSPIPLDLSETRADPRHVVGLGWFCRKELRYEDHVAFSSDQSDFFGMPKMTIHYELTPGDQATIAAARQEQARAAAAFGTPLKQDESRMVPAGSSLHYQGTTRMGERDDGESVCDPYSLVWGFQNLFVGGNGVIPTATACNPTATSVALAIRACERIAAILSAS